MGISGSGNSRLEVRAPGMCAAALWLGCLLAVSSVSLLAQAMLPGPLDDVRPPSAPAPDPPAQPPTSLAFRDTRLSLDARVDDLLTQMSVAEKAAQLLAFPHELFRAPERADVDLVERLGQQLAQQPSGHLSGVLKPYPLERGLEIVNGLQQRAVQQSRFGLPLLVSEECLHGCMAHGSTTFPVPIALASTWEPALVERTAAAIGREARARGIRQALAPIANLARDSRCGRTEETYGEDPLLASRLLVAFVRGLQGQGVAATLKHFVANFGGDGGRDSSAVYTSERLLREVDFPPFHAAIVEGGAACVMAAYNSLDGVPCHASPWLLSDVLKGEWGLRGFVVSDYSGVAGLQTRHGVADSPQAAALMALTAGLDVDLPAARNFRLLEAFPADRLDEAVRRVLRLKLELGLLEAPLTDLAEAQAVVGCAEHVQLAREVAARSMVLLKNEGGLLPLPRDLGTLAVLGPNAAQGRLGGYSASGGQVVSPLAGIHAAVSPDTVVLHAEGCEISDFLEADRLAGRPRMLTTGPRPRTGFGQALEAASRADVVLLFLGNMPGSEGEGLDRSDLDLPGVQEDLVRAVCATHERVVVVLVNGSAVTMERWIDEVEAVVEAWYPGEQGGHAIADVLFGAVAPAGRLPVTFPRSAGQLPMVYNTRPSGRALEGYIDLRGEQARFPFGFGLSTTTFSYEDLHIESTGSEQAPEVHVRLVLVNSGSRRGDEVVQLYLHQRVAEVSLPDLELRGFRRVTLDPGERRELEFVLTAADFEYLDRRLQPTQGQGVFDVLVGASSADFRLRGEVDL